MKFNKRLAELVLANLLYFRKISLKESIINRDNRSFIYLCRHDFTKRL